MAAPDSLAAVRRRYGWVASIYDWANLEGVLYADARARLHPAAMAAARPRHARTHEPGTHLGLGHRSSPNERHRMTPITSEAHVTTRNGPQYLAALCLQLEQRAQERARPDMTVEWKETDGTIELGWARCALRADQTGLSLRAEAEAEDALGQVCELIARHLETHADEPIVVSWSHLVSADTHDHRRDRMRAFHARMRHD
jgi:hypothetical protein